MSANTGAPAPYQSQQGVDPKQQALNQAKYVAGGGGNPFAMGGGKNSQPPPDYMGAAQNQAASSTANVNAQTQANRPNQTTDFGNIQWTQGPDGRWTQSASLSPGMGGLLPQFTGQLSNASGADAFKRASDAAYGQELSRLNPQLQLGQEQLDTQLANQGIAPGSAAYNQAVDAFGRQKNDALQTAYNNSVGLGLQAQGQQFQEGLGGLGALHGFETGLPGFNAAGQAQPIDYLGALSGAAGYNMQQQQLQQQYLADILGAATGIGSAAMGVPRMPSNPFGVVPSNNNYGYGQWDPAQPL